MSGEFVDTNVLLYAHDRSAGAKRDAAVALHHALDRRGIGTAQHPGLDGVLRLRHAEAAQRLARVWPPTIVQDFGTWPVFTPLVSDVVAATKLCRRYDIHFWDALIVQGAVSLGADVLWSEDLNAGQKYAGVPVRNPFA